MIGQSGPVCVRVTAVVPRYVCCEHCGEEYVYELTRAAIGEARQGPFDDPAEVADRATRVACAALAKALGTGAGAVPCPACLKYQDHMAAAAREVRWGWARRARGGALVALPVVAVAAVFVALIATDGKGPLPVILGVGAVVLFLALTALATAVYRFAPCRPNDWPEAYRAAVADDLACTRAEFNLGMRDGGPFVADLTQGREAEYEGVVFLWVLPEEIEGGETVPFVVADDRPVEVRLTPDDDDGVFLDESRVSPPGGAPCRICLRVFNVHASHTRDADADEP